jgi:hypothetical protein
LDDENSTQGQPMDAIHEFFSNGSQYYVAGRYAADDELVDALFSAASRNPEAYLRFPKPSAQEFLAKNNKTSRLLPPEAKRAARS